MATKKLEKGQFAPSIQTQTIFDKVVNIEAMADHKIWVAFYRYATCPLCELHFDDVLGRAEQLHKWGIRFVAIFESKVDHFPKRITQLRENEFFIVSDPNKFIYESYGIEVSWPKVFHPENIKQAAKAYKKGFKNPKLDGNLATIPAHFLIAPGGQIFEAHYGRSAGHHIDWKHVEAFAQAQFGEPEIELDLD